jgi:tetratricopeptide (TPR) repeat protein
MTTVEEIGRRYYLLGLAAAKERNLTYALHYVSFANILAPGLGEAVRLAEICRYELEEIQEPERFSFLAGQKKWKAAALAVQRVPHQSVRLLNIQGCFWALAKRYTRAADCFARALVKDRGNRLAADALAEFGRRRKSFGRFFCPFLPK